MCSKRRKSTERRVIDGNIHQTKKIIDWEKTYQLQTKSDDCQNPDRTIRTVLSSAAIRSY